LAGPSPAHWGAGTYQEFLLYAGILTGMQLADDIFLFHEEVAPKYLPIGEKFIIAIYLAMEWVFLLSNPDKIHSSDFLVLFLALTMFGFPHFGMHC
jgi:hypothetical protein